MIKYIFGHAPNSNVISSLIARAWGSYWFRFSFRHVSDSSQINGIQMFMYAWYPREYELKYYLSKSGSVIIRRFSLVIIDCKIGSLSSLLTKIEIRLRYRKVSTMMLLSIKYPFNIPPRITMERLLCVRDIGFCWDFNRLLVKPL